MAHAAPAPAPAPVDWSARTGLLPRAVEVLQRPPWYTTPEALFQGDKRAEVAASKAMIAFVNRVWEENNVHPFIDAGKARERWTARALLTANLWSAVRVMAGALGYTPAAVAAMVDPIRDAFAVRPFRALFAYRLLLLMWGVTEATWQAPAWSTAVSEGVTTWVERARGAFFAHIGIDADTGTDTANRRVCAADVAVAVPPASVAAAPRTDLAWLTDGVPRELAAIFTTEVRHVSASGVFSPSARGHVFLARWNKRKEPRHGYTVHRHPTIDSPHLLAKFLFEDQRQATGGGIFFLTLPAGALDPAPLGTMSWLTRRHFGDDGLVSADADVDTSSVLCLVVCAYSVEHGVFRVGIAPYHVGLCDAARTCPLPRIVPAPSAVKFMLPVVLAAHAVASGPTEPMAAHLSIVRGARRACLDADDADADDVLKRNNSKEYWANRAAPPVKLKQDPSLPVPVSATSDVKLRLSQSPREDSDDHGFVGDDFGGVDDVVPSKGAVMCGVFGDDATPPPTPQPRRRGKKRVVRGLGARRDAPSPLPPVRDPAPAPAPAAKRRVVIDDSDTE